MPSLTPTNKPIYWLLTIQFAGVAIRLSTDQVDVTTADGDVLSYEAGLDAIDLEEAIDLFGDSAGQLSIGLEFFSPVSIASLVAKGYDLSSARGELARWTYGTDYEARRVVLSGRLVDPEFAADDEVIKASLEEMLINDWRTIPPKTLAVNSSTWSTADTVGSSGLNRLYPIVIGKPGKVDSLISSAGWVTGSEAVWVDHTADRHTQTAGGGSWVSMASGLIVVVAGHHVSAERVYLNTEDYAAGGRFKVFNGFDARNNPIAFVPFYYETTNPDPYGWDPLEDYYAYTATDPDVGSGALYGLGSYQLDESFQANTDGSIAPGDGPRICVGWYDQAANGGGLAIDGKTIREAGDVIEYLLSLTSIPVDRQRVAAAKPKLSRFLLDGVIAETVSPWELLKDEILPLLPVSIVSGPNGVYPIVWDWQARASDAVASLNSDIDPSVARNSAVKYDDGDRANNIEITFARSYRTDTYCAKLTIGSALDAEYDDSVTVHPLCQFSRLRTGQRLDKEIEAAWVYDTSTAWAILEWQAAAYCLPSRTVEYLVSESDWAHLERGQVVTLTDSELYLEDQVCLILSIVTDGLGALRLGLSILDPRITEA